MAHPQIVLAGLSASLQGLRWESDTRLRIGRHDSADIVLHDPGIARHQAEVVMRKSKWVVRDLARSEHKPTLVNNQPLVDECLLQLKDVIQFASLALQVAEVRHAGGDEPAVPPFVNPGPGLSNSCIKTTRSLLRVDAAANHSWEEVLHKMSQQRANGATKHDHVFTLLRTGYHLCHLGSLDRLLQSVLADAVSALNAQRGSILLAEPKTGKLQVRDYLAPKLPRSQQCCFSRTMAERLLQPGRIAPLFRRRHRSRFDVGSKRSRRHNVFADLRSLRSPRKRLGVLQIDRGPMQMPFDADDFYLADAIAASVAIGIETAQLVEEQHNQFAQTVASLARAVEVRDYGTGNHTRRVTDYALLLADELMVPADQRYQIQIGTPLHDIGKIGIDDAILRKPDKLTAGEFEVMKTHTVKGAAILDSIHALTPMIPIVRHHHERWDGTGYPDGLADDRIDQLARIVAVADAFDAMTSDRPYRRAIAPEQAFAELIAKSGTHFDPACVDAFLRLRPYVEQLLLQK